MFAFLFHTFNVHGLSDGDDDYIVVSGNHTHRSKGQFVAVQLDRKSCAFKGIAAFLDAKGIDIDNNRFLILQGEVEMAL
jgi:structural maintenance of chromosome 4